MFGFEIKNADDLLLINENYKNNYITGIHSFTSSDLQLTFPTNTTTRVDPISNAPAFVEPDLYISIPVGGRIWDAQFNWNEYSAYETLSVRMSTENCPTYKIITVQNVDTLNDVSFNSDTFGAEIYNTSADLVWSSNVRSISLQSFTNISSGINIGYLTSPITLTNQNDFFCSLKNIGALADQGGYGLMLERSSTNEYIIRRDNFAYSSYSAWSGYNDPTYVRGVNWAYGNLGDYNFAAGVMSI